MRGADEASGSLFSCVDLQARIPARHPKRHGAVLGRDTAACHKAGEERLQSGVDAVRDEVDRTMAMQPSILVECMSDEGGSPFRLQAKTNN
jgi:hypothetical protein